MARPFTENRLVIASHSPGKVSEVAALLASFPLDVVAAATLGLAEPEENGASFAENAGIKARAAARGARLPALADDSGLVVPALDGAPGIHSARWAGPGRDFRLAMERVHERLGGASGSRARFTCVLALAWPPDADGGQHCETFEGDVWGRLVWPPRGERGFGYDPMFVPNGYTLTFGEMDSAEKHRISHRARACRKMVDDCLRHRQ